MKVGYGRGPQEAHLSLSLGVGHFRFKLLVPALSLLVCEMGLGDEERPSPSGSKGLLELANTRC